MPATAKKKANRQHAAKGSSFIRFAINLLEAAEATPDQETARLLELVAKAADKTGKEVSKLR